MADEYGDSQPMDYDDFFEDIDGANPEPSKFCADCDKVFFTNGLLEVHRQKVHEDASLLSCFTCNLDFKRKMGKCLFFSFEAKLMRTGTRSYKEFQLII